METAAIADNVRHLPQRQLALSDAASLVPAPPVPCERRIGLSGVEVRTVNRLLSGSGADEYVGVVIDRANSFATDDGARRRSLARAAGIAEAMLQELNLAFIDAVSRRDFPTVAMLDRVTNSATRRYTHLVEALQAEANGGRRPVLVVGQANTVSLHGAA